jgi:hypothetical protein
MFTAALVGTGMGIISGGITGAVGHIKQGLYYGAVSGAIVAGYFSFKINPCHAAVAIGICCGSLTGCLSGDIAERVAYARKLEK